MPKIGMRIIKSAIAVLCCFLISFLRRNGGIVFYSCIAAVLCIQQDNKSSKNVAFNRIKGTLIGGFFGMIVLLFERSIGVESLLIRYIMISFMIIPIIYMTVLLNMTGASYLSCVVFMSITISHALDVNPYLFTFNRMLDTLIGVFVALLINHLHLPHAYHKQTLFVVNLDQVLLHDGKISSYTTIKLRQLLEQDANILLATHRSPGAFLSIVKEIPLQLPIVAMNGAALYSIPKQEYSHCKFMHMERLKVIQGLIQKYEINVFTHTVVNQMLHVYYQPFQNPLEEEYYHKMRKTPYITYVCHTLPNDIAVLSMYIIERKEVVNTLYDDIRQHDVYQYLTICVREDALHSQYATMEIYDQQATKPNAIQQIIQEYEFVNVYEFISDVSDHLPNAQHSYVYMNDLLSSFSYTLMPLDDENSVAHKIDKIYHSRKKQHH